MARRACRLLHLDATKSIALVNRTLLRKTLKVQALQALQAALREQATQDALTGLFNRRHLNDTLPAMLALALREQQPLAAVVIDLDHFKLTNDNHGHPAGDGLLAAFGRLLRENCAKTARTVGRTAARTTAQQRHRLSLRR